VAYFNLEMKVNLPTAYADSPVIRSSDAAGLSQFPVDNRSRSATDGDHRKKRREEGERDELRAISCGLQILRRGNNCMCGVCNGRLSIAAAKLSLPQRIGDAL